MLLGTLAPEAARGLFAFLGAEPRAVVGHGELHIACARLLCLARHGANGAHGQFHGMLRRMAQGVFQQIAQGRDQQGLGDGQRPVLHGLAVVQPCAQRGRWGLGAHGIHSQLPGLVQRLQRIGRRIAAGQHGGSARFMLLQPRQQQQLLQRVLQVLHALARLGQRIAGHGAGRRGQKAGRHAGRRQRHLRHLHMGLDGGQRRAQLMGRVVAPAALAVYGRAHAVQQLVERAHQRRQLARLQALGHGRIVAGRAARQFAPQGLQRPEALGHGPPHQPHAGQQRQHEGQDDGVGKAVDQTLAHIDAVGRGDAHAVVLQHIGAPGLAPLDDGREAQRHALREHGAALGLGQHLRQGRFGPHGLDLAAHQADLAGHAVARDHVEHGAPVLRQLPGRPELVDDAGHHARRGDQPVIQHGAQLVAHVREHPGRHPAPQRAQRQAQTCQQAHAQAAHHGCRPRR